MSRFSFAIPRIALPERFNAILYNTFALPGLLLCAIAVVCSPLPSRSHASPLLYFSPPSCATACLICSFASLIFSQLSHDASSPCRAFPSHFMGLRSQDCAIPLFSLLLPRQSRISMLCPCHQFNASPFHSVSSRICTMPLLTPLFHSEAARRLAMPLPF